MSVLAALDLTIALLTRAHTISAIVAAAQTEGRGELNETEWKAIIDADDQARADLQAAIQRAKLEGR